MGECRQANRKAPGVSFERGRNQKTLRLKQMEGFLILDQRAVAVLELGP
jgi:hypothetical protein